MVTIPDAVIKKHWFVSSFTPPSEGLTPPLGALGNIDAKLFANVDDAKAHAKELAAEAPGAFYVVYEAMWYAFTDVTPVTLRRVGEALTA